jgi:hypothetical protein
MESDMGTNRTKADDAMRPNILILCMDQWDTHMQVPNDVQFPAMRLDARA